MYASIKLLTSRLHAASNQEGDAPERVPSLARLFSGLVSSLYALGSDDDKFVSLRNALLTLEGLPPPDVIFSPHATGSYLTGGDGTLKEGVLRTYVTSQRSYSKFGIEMQKGISTLLESGCSEQAATRAVYLRLKRAYPSLHIPRPIVFHWAGGDDELVGLLDSLAQITPRYGSTLSPAIIQFFPGDPPDDPEAVRHTTSPRGRVMVRVVSPGRLDNLESSFNSRTAADSPPTASYSACTEANGQWADAATFRLKSPRPLGLVLACKVADALRKAVCWHADQLGRVNTCLTSRDKTKVHAAYWPIPNVDHRNACGTIFGAAVLLPFEARRDDSVQFVLARLPGTKMDVDGMTVAIDRLDPTRPNGRLMNFGQGGRWQGELTDSGATRPTRWWSTVTPASLPFRHSFQASQEYYQGWVRTHLSEHLGLPTPDKVYTHRLPAIQGLLPAPAFSKFQRNADRFENLMHVTVRLPVPLWGPLAVGNLRNFGLGMMRPVYGDPFESPGERFLEEESVGAEI